MKKKSLSRREFVRGAAVSGAAIALSRFASAGLHVAGTDKIRIGLVGCGGRGTGAAEDCLRSSPGIELVALADLFPDRLESSRKNLTDPNREGGALPASVTDERCFTGFDAYEKLLALKEVDLVLLATPPVFRPMHFEAAIAAGKHVFMEKPVAVDPVGVRRVMAAGKQAREKSLAVVTGTQRRHQAGYIETIRRIHDGEIGKVVSARCFWNQGHNWVHDRKAGESDMEWQLRNWLYFVWTAGDHIVEQHIHNIDVVNWVVGAHPIRAIGVGGRYVRTEAKYGNIWDHFTIDYEYENGVHLTSMCRQIPGTEALVGESITGTLGSSNPAGSIEGRSSWKFTGKSVNPYVQEHTDLIASIRAGSPLNEAQQVAESTLTAILGREAAYTGKTVTWDTMMQSSLDLTPKRFEFGPLPVSPVAIPGRTIG